MNRRDKPGTAGGAARTARRFLLRVVRRMGRTFFGVVPRSMRKPAANDPKG